MIIAAMDPHSLFIMAIYVRCVISVGVGWIRQSSAWPWN